MKPALSDRLWFDRRTQDRYKNIRNSDVVKLNLTTAFLPLSIKSEVFLGSIIFVILPIVFYLFSFDKKVYSIGVPLVVIASVVLYIFLRRNAIKRRYNIHQKQNVEVSLSSIRLPAVITKKNDTLDLFKASLRNIEVYWWFVMYSDGRENRVWRIDFLLNNGDKFSLSGFAMPLKSILYLLIFFDYPVEFIESKGKATPSMFLLAVISLIIAVTGLLIYFFS